MNNLPMKELVNQLGQELIRQGYKESTLKYYRTNWRRILAYFDECGEEFFSEAIAMRYVNNKCNFFAKEEADLLTQSNIYLFRIVRIMGDFAQNGVVLRRYEKSLSRINDTFNQNCLETFATYCMNNQYAASTQKSYRRIAENFLNFLEGRNISLKTIDSNILTDFVKTLLGYSYKMVEFTLCGTRAFLRFLYNGNHLSIDLCVTLPSMQTRKQTRIPSVWTSEDLQQLMDAFSDMRTIG